MQKLNSLTWITMINLLCYACYALCVNCLHQVDAPTCIKPHFRPPDSGFGWSNSCHLKAASGETCLSFVTRFGSLGSRKQDNAAGSLGLPHPWLRKEHCCLPSRNLFCGISLVDLWERKPETKPIMQSLQRLGQLVHLHVAATGHRTARHAQISLEVSHM